uniref:Uncharacterized protein n=1 Tax=Anguilla anguilla TaxID=7936 RepID=A0A0E9RH53_ANGAN
MFTFFLYKNSKMGSFVSFIPKDSVSHLHQP